jgi:hypothetical protein
MSILTKRPVQIYLEQRQQLALKRLAAKRKVSVSELVREGVERLLTEMPIEDDPAWKLIGLGSSGVTDLAERHDEYLIQILDGEADL